MLETANWDLAKQFREDDFHKDSKVAQRTDIAEFCRKRSKPLHHRFKSKTASSLGTNSICDGDSGMHGRVPPDF